MKTPPAAKAPPVKTQGIKTKLVPFIRANIIWTRNSAGTWVEPFMGSGAVGFNMRPKRAIMADSNQHLVRLYQDIQAKSLTGDSIRKFLNTEGSRLLEIGEDHYYEIRNRFNDTPNSHDFLFLNRACFNGVMRFNSKGRFNVPFCRKPERFRQALVTKIANQIDWASKVISEGEYTFVSQSWRDTLKMVTSGDFIYADPPYEGRHTDYYNSWDDAEAEEFAATLKASKAGFALSTWLANKYRTNDNVALWFDGYDVRTEEHFYHVGASEDLRNSMTEALVIKPGYAASIATAEALRKPLQTSLFAEP